MSESKPLVLIVEDDTMLVSMVESALDEEGFEVKSAADVFQGKGIIEKHRPDLVLLDRALPDKDGLELCEWIRANENTKSMPVIFMTGKKTTTQKVVGLRLADDYIAKPFEIEELCARVHAVLRRTRSTPDQPKDLEAGGIRIDREARKVFAKKKEVRLTPKEFELLETFLERRGRALSRRFLLSHVWGYEKETMVSTKVVDVTVGHLREKLGPAAKALETVTGYGYRFEG